MHPDWAAYLPVPGSGPLDPLDYWTKSEFFAVFPPGFSAKTGPTFLTAFTANWLVCGA